MATDLTLYTNPQSRGRIARWMLEETGATYDTVVLDYGTTMVADAYRAINPMMKVPAIVHHGHVVTEGAAICAGPRSVAAAHDHGGADHHHHEDAA